MYMYMCSCLVLWLYVIHCAYVVGDEGDNFYVMDSGEVAVSLVLPLAPVGVRLHVTITCVSPARSM